MGFLDKLVRKRAELSVSTDRSAYLPGDVVEATVRLAGKKDFEIEEGRVELVYENEYTYTQSEGWDSDDSEIEKTTTTDRETKDKQRFLEAGPVAAGSEAEHRVSLRIPGDAAPTGEGEITKVRWKVEAILGVGRGLDPDAGAEITVLAPRAPRAAEAAEVDGHGDVDLELRLPGGAHVAAGETMAGTLVLRPREAIETQEVRIELVRKEHVPREQGNEHESVDAKAVLSGGVELGAGIPREFPFQLSVPRSAPPSFRTDQSTLRWYLRGVAARRMRSDYNIRQELNLYSAGGAAAAAAGSDEPSEAPADRNDSLDAFKHSPGGNGT